MWTVSLSPALCRTRWKKASPREGESGLEAVLRHSGKRCTGPVIPAGDDVAGETAGRIRVDRWGASPGSGSVCVVAFVP